jgi:hypothetical protein
MKRALSLTCLTLLLVVVGAARAEARPTIAILGLEVVDTSGVPTSADVQTAKELTSELRSRAMAGTGPYELAQKSDKELIDEKMLRNCDSEAPTCMIDIGKDVGGDFLLYGKMTKKGATYQVSLTLLDIGKGQLRKTLLSPLVPVGTTGPDLLERAKQMYASITGEKTSGTLVVKVVNADHGTILIDRAERGSVTNSTGQIANVDEGKHKLRVESEGFHPVEQDFTVNGGETKTITVTLEKKEVTGTVGVSGIGTGQGPGAGPGIGTVVQPTTRGSTAWKVVTVGAVVVAAGGIAYAVHANDKIRTYSDLECTEGFYPMKPGCASGPPSTNTKAENTADLNALDTKGEHWATLTNTSIGIGIGAGAIVLFAAYEGFIATHDSSSTPNEHADRGHRVHRDRFVVTPIVSPTGGGATLRIDW